ncbi:MAG: hypothetical protein QN179_09930 [Armatimonadota bacterium]|nr:hypothetical protein [Armatimonadota bacterium]
MARPPTPREAFAAVWDRARAMTRLERAAALRSEGWSWATIRAWYAGRDTIGLLDGRPAPTHPAALPPELIRRRPPYADRKAGRRRSNKPRRWWRRYTP